MKESEMYELVSKLNNKELMLLSFALERELHASDQAIVQGFEKDYWAEWQDAIVNNCTSKKEQVITND